MESCLNDIPEWLQARNLLTTDDLIRTGSCQSGVMEFRDEHFPNATAVPVGQILALCDSSDELRVIKAANGNGDGYGDGDGNGDGYGDGDGDGDGYGYGDGYGDGDGYGNGYGYE